MSSFGKLLILAGAALILVGVVFTFADRIPGIGRLPGDIHVKRPNFEFHFPLMTSILLSLLLTAVLWFIQWLRK